MGEKFYMDLEAFQAKYPTREMREQVLRQELRRQGRQHRRHGPRSVP